MQVRAVVVIASQQETAPGGKTDMELSAGGVGKGSGEEPFRQRQTFIIGHGVQEGFRGIHGKNTFVVC